MPRQFSLFLMFLALLAGTACASEGDSLWSHTYGGVDDDVAWSIIPSGDGGYLLAGRTASFGAGPSDIWLIKVDAQGDSLWSRTYGGSSYEDVGGIIPSGDGGFLLAGGTDSFGAGQADMWLVKVNAQGDSLWSHTYGGGLDDWAYAIIPSGDGGFLLLGETYSFSVGDGGVWLMKVDAQGNFLWHQFYGGTEWDAAYSIIPSNDGGFLLAGETYSFGAVNRDMWLLKANANGDSIWSHIYGGNDWDAAYSIVPSGDGGFLLAGDTWSFGPGSRNMWLVKVNADGDSVWSRFYGGGEEYANTIISTGDGCFLLAGSTDSFGAGSQDMWLVKVNSQGDSLWSHTYGAGTTEAGFSVIPSEEGNYLLAGYFGGSAPWGPDMWLVCVEGLGTHVPPESEPIHPSSFCLHPCHPNPFNPATILTFDLPVASLVKLEVFDINGRPIMSGSEATPTMFPAGTHQIPFDGSDLPSGIYLARLTAGAWQQTQKLILLK